MNIFSFHLMPFPDLPQGYQGPTSVIVPNSMIDRSRQTQILNEYFDQLVACEDLGLDGVAVNEHHQMVWGMMASPNLAAAVLAARTKRVKILVLGPALPLYGTPLRVAEELAIVDHLSHGRLIAGAVIGGPAEYHIAGIAPDEARGRFNEAIRLMIRAWTEPGPFEHYGEYYKIQHVNPWLLPCQIPHPPIWVPGSGSLETIDFCVENGFAFSALPFFPKAFSNKSFAMFRHKWIAAQRDPDPGKLSLLVPVYVAETDAKARAQYEEHYWYFTRLGQNRGTFVPGYSSEKSVLHQMQARQNFAHTVKEWKEVEEQDFAIVGSPQTVIEKLSRRIEETGVGNLLCMFHIGNMPHSKAMANIQAFATGVMPALKRQFPDGPRWQSLV
jgi:alkanesulfonate monooxygenase SsuD/methylene tetrahydromethanopterin reductase-like flavin-dependent oxidoreductase (luciferase family)